MAPFWAGEMSKRPGMAISTSRPWSSSGTVRHRVPLPPARSRPLSSSSGLLPASMARRSSTTLRPFCTLLAASSSDWIDCARSFRVSPSRSPSTVTTTAVPASSKGREAASVSEKITASNWPVGSENIAKANLLPFCERRSRIETTMPATRPATTPRSARASSSAKLTMPSLGRIAA